MASGKVTATIPAQEPTSVAIAPDGATAYVAGVEPGGGNSLVAVIDMASGTVTRTITLYESYSTTSAIAITPDGSHVYVTGSISDNVSVIDTASGTVTETITVGGGPWAIAITPDGSRAYIANNGNGTVAVIDTTSDTPVFTTPFIRSRPSGIAITPDGSRAYVSETGADSLAVIDTATNTLLGSPIKVGESPTGIAVAPDQPPTASLAATSGTAGSPLILDASASADPDGGGLTYDWDFGDGSSADGAGPTPSHTYASPGTYQATVTVDDGEGCPGFVFTGQTASCNGPSQVSATATVQVAAPTQKPHGPGGSGHPGPRAPQSRPKPPTPPRFAARIHLGRLRLDRRHGIARLHVWVSGPGTLSLHGKRLRRIKKRVVRHRGGVTLVIRPSRKAMRALRRRGHLKARAMITFRTTDGTVARGSRKVRLVRRRSTERRSVTHSRVQNDSAA